MFTGFLFSRSWLSMNSNLYLCYLILTYHYFLFAYQFVLFFLILITFSRIHASYLFLFILYSIYTHTYSIYTHTYRDTYITLPCVRYTLLALPASFIFYPAMSYKPKSNQSILIQNCISIYQSHLRPAFQIIIYSFPTFGHFNSLKIVGFQHSQTL